MSAPFVSSTSKPTSPSASSSSSAPNISTNHQHLYFPRSIPSNSTKIENVLLITNSSEQPAIWKMRRSTNTPFLVHPTSGVLHPHEERRIAISCTGDQLLPMITAADQGNFSEKLQLNARFFHESDNQENIAECWNNKKADGMKKLKLDLPVILAENKNASEQLAKQQEAHARSLPTEQLASQRNVAAPKDSVAPLAKSSSTSTTSAPTNTAATTTSISNNNNNNNNNNQQQQQSSASTAPVVDNKQAQQAKQQMQSPKAPVSPAPVEFVVKQQQQQTTAFSPTATASSANDATNNKPLYTPVNSPAGSASSFSNVSSGAFVSSSSAAPNNNNVSSPSLNVDNKKKDSAVEKIINTTIPIWVFVPLLLITFSLGARMSGGNNTNVGSLEDGNKKK